MDFDDSPEEAAFRLEARDWLARIVPLFHERFPQFEGSANPHQDEATTLAAARAWQALKYDDGYACLEWPEAYGGRGLSQMHAILFSQEEEKWPVPSRYVPLGVSLGTCAPAILHHGTEEQKRRYLPKLGRADELWCQLFSEPSAGSDLAGLRTRAERDGDDWVVNGQKVWNTGAHLADWGVLVTRHDPDLPKHKGMTYFVVDMKTPGIQVRPIKQIPGGAEFNEVFFANVRIPDENRLDEVGAGWTVAITTLMNERHGRSLIKPDITELFELVKELEIDGEPALESSMVRERLADWYVASKGLEHNYCRGLTAISKGARPGPEASITKIVRGLQRQEICSFGADLQDIAGILLDEHRIGAGRTRPELFQEMYLHAPRTRIAAGTDEILKNVIAERVLGLPGDIRADRGVPFRDIPTGPKS